MSQMLCCNQCGREHFEGVKWPYQLLPDGSVEDSGGSFVNGHWVGSNWGYDLEGEDSVTIELTGVRRGCLNCKKVVPTYMSHVNWGFWWFVVQRLREYQYITIGQLESLVNEEKEKKGYPAVVPLSSDSFLGYEEDTMPFMLDYLQGKQLLGPEKRYFFFSKRRKVLVTDDLKKEDFMPKSKVPIDGTCPECGKSDFCRESTTCLKCGKGKLEYIETCEPIESRGKEEFEIEGESFGKELYSNLFSRYTQAQLSTKNEVIRMAEDHFEGSIRRAAAALENSWEYTFSPFSEDFVIKDEVFKKEDYPCLSITYSDDKVETVERVVEIAEKQFLGDIKQAVVAEDKRLRDKGLCVSQRKRVVKHCATC